MRKVRVIAHPEERARPVGAEIWNSPGEESSLLLRFRHRCDDDWFASLLQELSLEGKRLTPQRARRLLLAALMKGDGPDGD
jgi:hypothetical protein